MNMGTVSKHCQKIVPYTTDLQNSASLKTPIEPQLLTYISPFGSFCVGALVCVRCTPRLGCDQAGACFRNTNRWVDK